MIRVRNLAGASAFIAIAAVLSGCGATYIRDTAQEQLSAGQYEKALKTFDEGLARHPDSVVLRAGRIAAQNAVFSRLMAEATTARASGNEAGARAALQRALDINANDERAKSMLLDLERDQRRKAALASARELQVQGMHERAMLVVEAALKDNPNDSELLAFQREQELAAREAELTSGSLSETRPVSLDFQDANLRMVLDILTRNSGTNFILDKDVRSDLRTTVFLRQTKLEDALALLTATNGNPPAKRVCLEVEFST